MTMTVRALPTPYDPPDAPVTVATPTCCCSSCCCCCLNATAASVTVAAGAAYGAAAASDRPRFGPTLLGVLALPIAVAVGAFLAPLGSQSALAVGFVVYVGLFAAAMSLGGAQTGQAVWVALGIAGLLAVLFVVEVPLAFVTGFLVELLAPLALWIGFKLGFRTGARLAQPEPGSPT